MYDLKTATRLSVLEGHLKRLAPCSFSQKECGGSAGVESWLKFFGASDKGSSELISIARILAEGLLYCSEYDVCWDSRMGSFRMDG